MAIVEYQPESLLAMAPSLQDGTLLFCHKPFRWYSLPSYSCAFMRWVLKSKRYHHAGLIWQSNGLCFVVEATFFQRSRPKRLENWITDREGYVIGVKPQLIEAGRIIREFDKPYDLAAAISLVYYRVTGRWNGRTGTRAERKNFCFELIHRAMGLEKPWMGSLDELIN